MCWCREGKGKFPWGYSTHLKKARAKPGETEEKETPPKGQRSGRNFEKGNFNDIHTEFTHTPGREGEFPLPKSYAPEKGLATPSHVASDVARYPKALMLKKKRGFILVGFYQVKE
ncbi:hypothetical protein TNCV_2869301 [Trichonephila clavipes]|nr:hypothetical protein TNCV_2869301 [Trichonephila clavipes]